MKNLKQGKIFLIKQAGIEYQKVYLMEEAVSWYINVLKSKRDKNLLSQEIHMTYICI